MLKRFCAQRRFNIKPERQASERTNGKARFPPSLPSAESSRGGKDPSFPALQNAGTLARWALTFERAARARSGARRDRLNDAGNTSVGQASPLCGVVFAGYFTTLDLAVKERRTPAPKKVATPRRSLGELGNESFWDITVLYNDP